MMWRVLRWARTLHTDEVLVALGPESWPRLKILVEGEASNRVNITCGCQNLPGDQMQELATLPVEALEPLAWLILRRPRDDEPKTMESGAFGDGSVTDPVFHVRSPLAQEVSTAMAQGTLGRYRSRDGQYRPEEARWEEGGYREAVDAGGTHITVQETQWRGNLEQDINQDVVTDLVCLEVARSRESRGPQRWLEERTLQFDEITELEYVTYSRDPGPDPE